MVAKLVLNNPLIINGSPAGWIEWWCLEYSIQGNFINKNVLNWHFTPASCVHYL